MTCTSGCRAGTQKIRNIERNPKVSLLLQSGGSMQDIKGLMIQGVATVFTEPADTLRIRREAARLRGVPEADLPTEARPGSAYIRVEAKRMISWDYARQGVGARGYATERRPFWRESSSPSRAASVAPSAGYSASETWSASTRLVRRSSDVLGARPCRCSGGRGRGHRRDRRRSRLRAATASW